MRSRALATDILACLLFGFVVWHGCEAHAQEEPELPDISAPCAPEVTENRRAVVQHDGDAGVWFQLSLAQCMLGRLAALPRYAERVSLLEERLRVGDERTALLRRQVQLAEQEAERASASLEAAMRGQREAREEANTERSLRWVWFGVGVVVVVAVEALALWAWSELSD